MTILSRVLEALILPPGGIILLIVLGMLIRSRWRKSGNFLIILALVILYAASTPAVVRPLENYMASQYPVLHPGLIPAEAIVVLGSGRRDDAAEYRQPDTVSRFGLERLRYAAWLHRHTRLPILVTGGRVYDEQHSEAELMQRYLQDQGLSAAWLEDQSRSTWENALYSKRILDRYGIRRVLLVTHGLHMPRAVWSFEQAGLVVTPAPTVTRANRARGGLLDFLPDAGTLHTSKRILHEWLGLVWYRNRH